MKRKNKTSSPYSRLTFNMEVAETKKKLRRRISEEMRRDIERRVNIEKLGVTKVAREMGLPHTTVGRIAGVARGDENYLARYPSSGRPRVEASMPLCPFPPDCESLRGKRLSVEEKYYLGCLVNIERQSANSVAERYQISRQAVYRISRKTLIGEALDVRGGARSALDAESDVVLRTASALEGNDRPTSKMMKALIMEEAANTLARRRIKCVEFVDALEDSGGDVSPARFVSLSKQTLKKYLTLYGY